MIIVVIIIVQHYKVIVVDGGTITVCIQILMELITIMVLLLPGLEFYGSDYLGPVTPKDHSRQLLWQFVQTMCEIQKSWSENLYNFLEI